MNHCAETITIKMNTVCCLTEKKEYRLKHSFLRVSHLLSWEDLHLNHNAIDLLESNFEHIYWNILSGNKKAGRLLAKCPDLDLLCWMKLSTNDSAFEHGLFDNLENFKRIGRGVGVGGGVGGGGGGGGGGKGRSGEGYGTFHGLSRNPHPKAIEFLKQNKRHICWEYIAVNEGEEAVELIMDNFYRVNVGTLSGNTNPAVIQFIEEYELLDQVSWQLLSANPSAVDLLKKYEERVDWYYASKNPNPEMFELFERNINKIDWGMVSLNPGAIRFIEKYLRYVDWALLSENPSAVHILEHNLEKVDFDALSRNPAIFELHKIVEL
jgi:hypothetical protein